MTRSELPPRLVSTKVIAVVRGLDPARALDVSVTLTANGVDVVEITMDSPNAAESIASVASHGIIVGAGTIRAIDEVAVAVESGADFLVSPHTDMRIVEYAVSQDIAFVPGVMTPTEAVSAWNAGVAAVKVFPASAVGPEFLGALLGPIPELQMIPTGGITASEAPDFLATGAVAVGVGGWLTAHKDLGVVAARAAALVDAIASA